MPPRIVVAASGGLDSTVLAYDLVNAGHDTVLISFDYGQRHRRELHAAGHIADELKADHEIVDLRGLSRLFAGSALTDSAVEVPARPYTPQSLRTTVVPARNAILLSVAAGAAASRGIGEVAFAAHGGDHPTYPDCRPAFVEAMDHAVRSATEGVGDVRITAPYVGWNKARIVERGHRLGVPFALTWSCYRGLERHCGVCSTCLERRGAFTEAGVIDPTVYGEGRG